jgi:transaldolase
MRKAGVEDYEDFARRLLAVVPDRPISLEVFADEPREMVRQAEAIASWGKTSSSRFPS